MQQAYAHAVAQRYRFYSYGDACLLSPARSAP
jgi:S-adenosylmethionine:tRNA ribosyltransferase-isomerase